MSKTKETVNKLFSLGMLKVDSLSELEKASADSGREILEEAMITGMLTSDALPYILSENLDIPFMVLQEGDVDPSLASLIPYEIAWGESVIPLSKGDGFITVGVYNPMNPKLFKMIEKVTGKKARVALVGEESIRRTLLTLYPPPVKVSDRAVSGSLSGDINLLRYLAAKNSLSLITAIMHQSRIAGFSFLTLHYLFGKFFIEGKEGVRSEVLFEAPSNIGDFIFSGLMKLCNFRDEKAAVMERIIETTEGKPSGMYKVALVSGVGSKKAVIRIIPNAMGKLSIDDIGLNGEQFDSITDLIKREKGMYIISSPTYDGVSTTLYSMVRYARKPGARIVAIEEDIWYKSDGFIQIERQVMGEDLPVEKIIRTLAPDILLYNNLSIDKLMHEVAPVYPSAVSIFAGVQCTSLDEVLKEILEAKVYKYALVSSLKAVIFQKLVRILCDTCKKELPAIPSIYLTPEMVESGRGEILGKMKYYMPSGCEMCGGTGYIGKTAIFDMVVFSPSVRMEILTGSSLEEKREKILSSFRLGPEKVVVDMLMQGRVTFEDVSPFLDLISGK